MLWDNTTRVAFTLAAAAMGIVAVYLMPGRKQIEERMTGAFDRSGKYTIFVLAITVTGIAGVLAWEVFRYQNRDPWVGLNMLFFAILGICLLGANLWTMRMLRQAGAHVHDVEEEVIELSSEEGTQPGLLATGPQAHSDPPVAQNVAMPAGPPKSPME